MPNLLTSFVPVEPGSPFPLENLPYGVFRPHGEAARPGVALGGSVVDLAELERTKLLDLSPFAPAPVFDRPTLAPFMALGRPAWVAARRQLQSLLAADSPELRANAALRARAIFPLADVAMQLPVEIGDYTDFYSSRDHATRVGAMIRGPQNALQPNWLHLPVAYHGRASSIVVSGTDIRRPWGQLSPGGGAPPVFAPSRKLDFELEVGFFIGPGNPLGEPVSTDAALDHVFGLVLVNDWSARDIQAWESNPLGPFLSKNFATSISPWIVTLEALAPFAAEGPPQDPAPLPYLATARNPTWNVALQASLLPEGATTPTQLCRSNLRYLYWNIRQQLAHHTCGGCNLRTGDLLATGTVSGPAPEEAACLLELTTAGTRPLALAEGGERRFLEDGDRVTFEAWCERENLRVGFGELAGRIVPAH